MPGPAAGRAVAEGSGAAPLAESAGVARSALAFGGLSSDSPRSARLCAMLATLSLGAVLPMLMVVANKSAPATLAAGALFANLAVILAGRGEELKRRYMALLSSRTTLIAAAVVALFVVSFAWTVDAGMTRRGLIEGVPELVFALATAAAWPLAARPGDVRWLAWGLVGAAALIVFEHGTGMPLHALVRARGEAWDLKRSAIPPALLLWPAVAYYVAHGRRLVPLGLFAAACVGIVFSHSGAPGFALIVGAASYALASLAPRAALAFFAAILLFLILVAPWTGTLASRVLPNQVESALSEEHASHRIQIWTAFERRVHDRPILGHGFDSSFKVSTAARPGGVPPAADNAMMVDNHPHNIFLQFWVELGLLGGLAAAGVAAFALRRIGESDLAARPTRLALLASIVAIGLVGLSAWQPWWLASIAVSLIWFDLFRLRPDL